jgi:hypothetical protein
MTSKIKIKLGPVEVEYEGSEEFLKKELPDLLSAISQLYKESGISTLPTPAFGEQHPIGQLGGSSSTVVGTTGTIAAKMSVSSGPELAIAAAARLMLGLGQGSFTRDQLLTEMKNASSYYKKSYGSNLSNILGRLVKSGKLVETAKDTYALSASTKSDLETRIAS